MEKKIGTRIPPPAGDRNARPVWAGLEADLFEEKEKANNLAFVLIQGESRCFSLGKTD